MKLWCRGQRYWTGLIEGDVRVDLVGAITGVVTAVEAQYGKNQEETRHGSRLLRIVMIDRVDRQNTSTAG
ncbi:ProQ/FINO family protein [Caballeronia arvi]|uniref:ProQ/FINO family protein n=1 Tax=Caballeronia arvi TaxID=1777135 RepID=UPI000B362EB9